MEEMLAELRANQRRSDALMARVIKMLSAVRAPNANDAKIPLILGCSNARK